MSVLIMKDTRNPENESIYSTTRAGTISVIKKSTCDYQKEQHTDHINEFALESEFIIALITIFKLFFNKEDFSLNHVIMKIITS